MAGLKLKFANEHFESYSEYIFLVGCALISFGILLVTVGGSWDITNHLLSKPDTFFSPPHAVMYLGVTISLIGTTVAFVVWRQLQESKKSYFPSLRYSLIGIGLLSSAGPFDYVWHSNFGLDGLLSPPSSDTDCGDVFLCRRRHVRNLKIFKNPQIKKIPGQPANFGSNASMAIRIRHHFITVFAFFKYGLLSV